MPATLLMMAGKPKLLERKKCEPTLAQDRRNIAKKPRGEEIWMTLEETSKAEKRGIEEEDRASLEKASRASRESPALKRKNGNEYLEEDENFGRLERSRTVSMESDALTRAQSPEFS